MKITKLFVFRLLAAFASGYHFLLGLIGTLGSESIIVSVVKSVYGANLTIDDQILYLAKFISAYMLAFAVAMALLAWKPVKYRNILWVAVTLFSIRIVERIVFFSTLESTFDITWGRNLQVIIPIAILVVGFLTLQPKSAQE